MRDNITNLVVFSSFISLWSFGTSVVHGPPFVCSWQAALQQWREGIEVTNNWGREGREMTLLLSFRTKLSFLFITEFPPTPSPIALPVYWKLRFPLMSFPWLKYRPDKVSSERSNVSVMQSQSTGREIPAMETLHISGKFSEKLFEKLFKNLD